MRVLLTGYYGRGNFGDDVLLHVTHSLVRTLLPHAHMHIQLGDVGGEYVAGMFPDAVLLRPGRHGQFDRIVHGGGGVFFDFKTHGWKQRWIEKILLQCIGQRHYIRLEHLARFCLGKARSSAMRRIGMGIGVGTFTAGSPKLRQVLPTLSGFDALWVREGESLTNLKRFQEILSGKIVLGSDLAFLTEHWLSRPQQLAVPVSSGNHKLGVVLRDWPLMDKAKLLHTLTELAARYSITVFILDAKADPETTALLSPFAMQIWQPERMRIADFAQLLATQDVLLTSRLHGAICGACVGVPSVVVEIEPKLKQLHAMLPHSTRLVGLQDFARWGEAVEHARHIAKSAIAADVAQNRALSEAALQEVQKFLP